MLFNELIEQQGLDGITSKTNISTVNLNYLLNEDFEKLNRVRSLGFLLILEREYKEIDVSELRSKIKLYFEEHKTHDDKVVMVARDSTSGEGFSFFKFFILAGLIAGAYYLYTEGKLDSLLQNVEQKENFFDDKKALENNATIEDAKKVVVGKSNSESIDIETPVAPKSEPIALSKTESEKSTVSEIQAVASNEVVTENNQPVKEVVEEVSQEFLASEESSKPLTEATEDITNTISSSISTISINPTRGMLWYGFINLDNKKRREFMKKVSTPFEIDNGRWLLVTGHGFVDIVSDVKTLEIADNKKHYFFIDSSDIKEIGKKEFRELNGYRGW
jgi:hypothetical protein